MSHKGRPERLTSSWNFKQSGAPAASPPCRRAGRGVGGRRPPPQPRPHPRPNSFPAAAYSVNKIFIPFTFDFFPFNTVEQLKLKLKTFHRRLFCLHVIHFTPKGLVSATGTEPVPSPLTPPNYCTFAQANKRGRRAIKPTLTADNKV